MSLPSSDAVAEIALIAIEATTRPKRWNDLCDLVSDRLGAAAFMVLAHDLTGRRTPVTHVSRVILSPRAQELVEGVKRGEDVDDHEGYRSLAREPHGRVITEHDMFDLDLSQGLPLNAWRDKVLSFTGGRSRSAMKLNDIGPFLDCAIVHDGKPHDEVPPPMTALAPFLAPMLARAIEASRIMSALAESYDALMTLFDRLDFGAAFCLPSSRIVTANRAFREMARDRDGIAADGNMLTSTSAAGTAQIRHALTETVRSGGRTNAVALTLRRRSGRLPLVLRAAPIRSDQIGAGVLVMVLIIDPEESTRISARGLAVFDLLSPAELDVCDLLVRGHGTDAIAGRRETSVETTRGQIKSASAKLACRSRLDLLRLAMASHVPVGDGQAEE